MNDLGFFMAQVRKEERERMIKIIDKRFSETNEIDKAEWDEIKKDSLSQQSVQNHSQQVNPTISEGQLKAEESEASLVSEKRTSEEEYAPADTHNKCNDDCEYDDGGRCIYCMQYHPNAFLVEEDGTKINIWNPKLAERLKDMPRIDTDALSIKEEKKE